VVMPANKRPTATQLLESSFFKDAGM